MEFDKLTLKTCLCLILMLSLLINIWPQNMQEKSPNHAIRFLVAVDLCCSLKVEKVAKSLSISVTLGNLK